MATIELVTGNIVDQKVDAIVNAANTTLGGGGGVDGAIHRRAGPALLEECLALPQDARGRRCPTGDVRVTGAGNLGARYVIHAVGPVYDAAHPDRSAELLRSVHKQALLRASELGCKTVALPAISTGAYHYPVDAAARVALGATERFLREHPGSLETVHFVLFGPEHYQAFLAVLGAPTWST
jgi:O-acetyl-ADP-ribose deacetylase